MPFWLSTRCLSIRFHHLSKSFSARTKFDPSSKCTFSAYIFIYRTVVMLTEINPWPPDRTLLSAYLLFVDIKTNITHFSWRFLSFYGCMPDATYSRFFGESMISSHLGSWQRCHQLSSKGGIFFIGKKSSKKSTGSPQPCYFAIQNLCHILFQRLVWPACPTIGW